MKKSIVLILSLLFSFYSAQKNEKYVRIDFSSICCGTPYEKPLLDYTKEFSQQNKLKKFEVWLETGLGYEGEFALFIGIDELNKTKKTKFISGLKALVDDFESNRNINQDGNIRLSDEFVAKDQLIKRQNNPTNQFSKVVLYDPKVRK